MERDIPLGRIAGIKIGFSWSVLLIAGLYTFLLATQKFPADAPGHGSAAYWAAGIVGALLFFGSLLAHEMAHALVARHEGIGVQGITLWLLGGFARLESDPASPGAMFRVAAAGPTTNAALAGAFWGLHQAFGGGGSLAAAVHGNSLPAVVCGWLAFINALLAAFNIFPAAPLDGGHVLAAGLWAATHDRHQAVTWAARAGVGLGFTMAAAGFLALQTTAADFGLWLIVVGWFILSSARRDLAVTAIEDRLAGVTLARVMHPDPPIVPEHVTVDSLTRTLSPATAHHAFPVQGADGRIVGLLSREQIVHTDPWHRANTPVGQLAFPMDRVTWAATTDDALPAIRRLAGTGVPTVLVVWPDGRVAGTAGPEDLDAVLRAPQPTRT